MTETLVFCNRQKIFHCNIFFYLAMYPQSHGKFSEITSQKIHFSDYELTHEVKSMILISYVALGNNFMAFKLTFPSSLQLLQNVRLVFPSPCERYSIYFPINLLQY